MTSITSDYIRLNTATSSLVLSPPAGGPVQILYWGQGLSDPDIEALKLATTRQHMHGGADRAIHASVLNEIGAGMTGGLGFRAHRGNGTGWASLFEVAGVSRLSDHHVEINVIDKQSNIRAQHSFKAEPGEDIIIIRTRVTNTGERPLYLEHCAPACLPLDPRATRLRGYTGRWAGEFTMEDIPEFTGSYVRENRSGRTSHHSYPALIAAHASTTELAGAAFGFHLGWSGNHSLRVERLIDGRTFVDISELLFPGEIILASGDTYETPPLHIAYSGEGYSGLSHNFHAHVRNNILPVKPDRRPRPIHYNTWEAVYFDHDSDKLFKLAEKAADVGAERFVLDDGWFGARRNDRAGLGDWFVSPDVYPDGLSGLIEKVKSLGMEFGLWFEPEMVNPDSDLYRAHPDWVLEAEGLEQIPSRGQYALDLTKPQVTNYLYKHLHALLSQNDIAYIKWDMNRDIHHPGSRGRPAISAQTHALYALLGRIRASHPALEIESCSSGGARSDFGVLEHADRVWTSDSNDALDRQLIQRNASHFLPLDVTGAHVGPHICHITGRRHSMAFRVATAFFGHMGMELNLLEERPEDLSVLKTGLALHKQHRGLIHTGRLVRLDTRPHSNAFGIVADGGGEALFSWAKLSGSARPEPDRLYFAGLDPQASYTLRLIWPDPVRSITAPSIIEAADLRGGGAVFSGELLMKIGLQLPAVHPETCLIFHLKAG